MNSMKNFYYTHKETDIFFKIIFFLYLSYELIKIYPLISNTNWGVYDWDTSALHFIVGYIIKNDISNFLLYFKDICGGIYANQLVPSFFFIPGYLTLIFSVDISFLITILLIKGISFYGSYKYFNYIGVKKSYSIFASLLWVNIGYVSARYSMGHLALMAYLLYPYLAYLFFKKNIQNTLLLALLLSQITAFGLTYLQIYFSIFLAFNYFLVNEKLKDIPRSVLRFLIIQIPSILIILPNIYGFIYGINEVRQANIQFFNHYIYNTGYNIFEYIISSNFLNFDDTNILVKLFNTTDEQVGAIGWLERYNYMGPIFIFLFFFINKEFLRKNFHIIILIFFSYIFILNFSLDNISLDRENYESYTKKYSLFQIFNISENTNTWLRMPTRLTMISNFLLIYLTFKIVSLNSHYFNNIKRNTFLIAAILAISIVNIIINPKIIYYVLNFDYWIIIFSILILSIISLNITIEEKLNIKNFLLVLLFINVYGFLFLSSDYYMLKRASFNNQSLEYIYESDQSVINNLDGYWRLSDTNWVRSTSVCKLPKVVKFDNNFNYNYLLIYNSIVLAILLIILFLLIQRMKINKI